MQIKLHTFQLQLKHAFTISRRSFDSQRTLIVEVFQDGISGYGEATHNPYYKNTEIENMCNELEAMQSLIENTDADSPEAYWNIVSPSLRDYPFALCALDIAIHDWFARKAGLPLYEYWGLNLKSLPQTSYTLSIDTPEILAQRMAATPWPVYKIKLGTYNDVQLVSELRKHTDATFWVDANCAWSASETIEKSVQLKKLGVEFIEQPMPADAWEAMEEVFQKSALPLIADEACRTESDIEKCVGRFHGINIKVMKCGGLTPALRMIRKAKQLGLKVMVGCMTESTVGISAIAHLLPLLDYADMDGALFLKEDIASGVRITKDGPVFPVIPGTGVVMKNMM